MGKSSTLLTAMIFVVWSSAAGAQAAVAPAAAPANLLPPDLRVLLMRNGVPAQGIGPHSLQRASPAAALPKIISAQILTPNVNVQQAPATPAISIKYFAPGALFCLIATLQSPFGQRYGEYYGDEVPVNTSGTITVQTAIYPMTLYTGPGAWNVTNLYIEDYKGNYNLYTGRDLAKTLPHPTIKIVNNSKPDLLPPTVSSGKILTPKVSVSSSTPYFEVQLRVADNLSGVYSFTLFLECQGGHTSTEAFAYAPSPILKGTITGGVDMSSFGSALGTWTIAGGEICDLAGNCRLFTDIKKPFGTTTFKLTK
jgi:hypothetical protein